MNTAHCPLCSSDIIIEDETFEGDLIDCPNCLEQLEVVSLSPLQIAVYGDEVESETGVKEGADESLGKEGDDDDDDEDDDDDDDDEEFEEEKDDGDDGKTSDEA